MVSGPVIVKLVVIKKGSAAGLIVFVLLKVTACFGCCLAEGADCQIKPNPVSADEWEAWFGPRLVDAALIWCNTGSRWDPPRSLSRGAAGDAGQMVNSLDRCHKKPLVIDFGSSQWLIAKFFLVWLKSLYLASVYILLVQQNVTFIISRSCSPSSLMLYKFKCFEKYELHSWMQHSLTLAYSTFSMPQPVSLFAPFSESLACRALCTESNVKARLRRRPER